MIKYLNDKLLALFGTAFSLFSDQPTTSSVTIQKPSPVVINTSLKKTVKINPQIAKKNKVFNRQSKKNLNQTKVYLLVTKDFKQKEQKNILLLVQTEDRLNINKNITNNRYGRLLLKSRHKVKPKITENIEKKSFIKRKLKTYKQNPFRLKNRRRLYFSRVLRPAPPPKRKRTQIIKSENIRKRKLKNRNPKIKNPIIRKKNRAIRIKKRVQVIRARRKKNGKMRRTNMILSKIFRNGKSYYAQNKGGYKSICPVFFDKKTAEEFLVTSAKKGSTRNPQVSLQTLDEVQSLPMIHTKIIELGLGDFIEFYSTPSQENILEKVEFLFFPDSEQINTKQYFSGKKICVKGFAHYKKEFYNDQNLD